MTSQTMEDALFDFYSKEESQLDRSIFVEQDILIPHISECQPGYSFRHSEFESENLDNVYVAGIAGMNDDSFYSDALYNDFYVSTLDWTLKVRDAEKSDSKPKDANMCWAATDSNLMIEAGWIPYFINNEDELFDLYRNAFMYGDSREGIPYDGVDWFLTGHYAPIVDDPNCLLDECYPGTGGYFADVITDISNYLDCNRTVPNSYDILREAISYLKQGKAVGLRVAQRKWGVPDRGHIITLQGYTYKLITNDETPYEKVTGIIVTDSNDDKDAIGYGGEQGSFFAPNILKVIPVHFFLGEVFLDCRYLNNTNAGWSPWRITHTTIVTPADFSEVVSNGDIVRQGATLLDEEIKHYEALNVSANGLAHNTTVSSGGFLNIFSGGSSLNTIVSSGGFLNVSSGGTALNTNVLMRGSMIVSSGGVALQTFVNGGVLNIYPEGRTSGTFITSGGTVKIYSGGTASQTILDGGNAYVSGGGALILDNQIAPAGIITLGGRMIVGDFLTNYRNTTVTYQLDKKTPTNTPLISNLSCMDGISTLTLDVRWNERFGNYTLAQYIGGFNENGFFIINDSKNHFLISSLSNHWTYYSFPAGSHKAYSLRCDSSEITLTISYVDAYKVILGDNDGNGISDVHFVKRNRSESEGLELQYGIDGTSELYDAGLLDSTFQFAGFHDISSDYCADLITSRRVENSTTDYLVVEYAQSGDLNDIHEIDRIDNSGNVDWNIYCGNLAGHEWKNSILWHAPDLGSLGYWADAGGNNSWVTIGTGYDYDWEVLGLGDFTNDSVHRDSVLFKYGTDTIAEVTADNNYRVLGGLGTGWDVVAIGDFSNDGVDDLILYHTGSSIVGKWADGVDTGWSSLGTVDTGTVIEGAGDYNGDGSLDLLARQSDGTMGYYASANLSQFTSFGYAMDSSWTVIA